MIQTGLYQLLTTTTAITNLLGTTRTDKTSGVFPMLAIGGATMPYIVFQRVTGQSVESFAGPNKMQESRFRFSCYGSSYENATNLAEQLKLTLEPFTGALPDGTVVYRIAKELEADDSEPLPHGTIYGVHVDFVLLHVDNNGA